MSEDTTDNLDPVFKSTEEFLCLVLILSELSPQVLTKFVFFYFSLKLGADF